MFLSYDLTKGAPHKRVWYCVCDSGDCDRFLGPFSTWQKQDQRRVVEDAGWTYGTQSYEDLCEECAGPTA